MKDNPHIIKESTKKESLLGNIPILLEGWVKPITRTARYGSPVVGYDIGKWYVSVSLKEFNYERCRKLDPDDGLIVCLDPSYTVANVKLLAKALRQSELAAEAFIEDVRELKNEIIVQAKQANKNLKYNWEE